MNWRCFFGIHKWGRWGDPRKREMTFVPGILSRGTKTINYMETTQDRTCEKCGLIETQEVGGI